MKLANNVLESDYNKAVALLANTMPHLVRWLYDNANYIISEDAPSSWEALNRESLPRLMKGMDKLKVSPEGLENSHFEYPCNNAMFRLWHDLCHLTGRYDFSLEGEKQTCKMQQHQFKKFLQKDEQKDLTYIEKLVLLIIEAEVYGQAAYASKTNNFVLNQKAFNLHYINVGKDKTLMLDWSK